MNLFNRSNAQSYEQLDIVNYRSQFFGGNTDHVLVDVRTTGEFRGGHVPGAINIPLDQISARMSEIPSGKPVVVICASGNRSKTGAKRLSDAGYDRVYNLKGGTMSWMMAGLPLES